MRRFPVFLLTTIALFAITAAAHGQSAPVITGQLQSDNTCDSTVPHILNDGDNSTPSYYVVCGSGLDSSLTISAGGEPQLIYGSVYAGQAIAIIGGLSATTGPIPNTVDMTICNEYGCTVYPNGWTWTTDYAYPSSVSDPLIDDAAPATLVLYGVHMDTTAGISICGQPATIIYNYFYDPAPEPYLNPSDVFIVPPQYLGGPLTCDISVRTNSGLDGSYIGTNTLANAVTYYNVPTPEPATVTPSTGPVAGGTVVTISGAFFGSSGYTVTVDGVAATDIVNNGYNSITATVPASVSGAHTASVSVTGPNGTGTLSAGFVYGGHTGVFLADQSSGTASIAADGSVISAPTSGGGTGLVVDNAGSVWSLDATGTGVSRFTSVGALDSDFTGLSLLSTPTALATDGAGLIWIANSGTPSITAVNSSGAAVGTSTLATDTVGAAPSAIAVDEAGGIWIASKSANQVTHIIGAATPVVTPIASGVAKANVGKKP